MSENAETTQSTVNPVDDLEGYLKSKDPRAKAEAAEEPEAQPAEPAEAQPAAAEPEATPEETKKVSWRELPLDDVDDKFLKDQPAGRLWDSYVAARREMQEAQRERNEARREVEQLRQAATPKEPAPAPQPQQLPNPDNDPEIEEINKLFWEKDSTEALKLMDKRAEERARAIAREEYQQASQAQTTEHWKRASVDASAVAAQRAMEAYGWDETALAARMKSVLPIIQDYVPQYGPGIWTNPDVYMGALKYLYGDPPQAQAEVPEPAVAEEAPTPKPAITNPPGSGRPAPVTRPVPKAGSPLSREQQEARRAMAAQVAAQTGIQIDVDKFARGGRKGANG